MCQEKEVEDNEESSLSEYIRKNERSFIAFICYLIHLLRLNLLKCTSLLFSIILIISGDCGKL